MHVIEAVRERLGLTKKDMAARLGLSRYGYYKRIQSDRVPRPELLGRLQELSGWSWEALMAHVGRDVRRTARERKQRPPNRPCRSDE